MEKLRIVYLWYNTPENNNEENKTKIDGFRNTFGELTDTPNDDKERALLDEIDAFIESNSIPTIVPDDDDTQTVTMKGGRRRSSTARKSSSRRGRRSSKKRATKSKPKRRQRRASRRAY
jgi:hypothetical protein